MVVAAAAAAVVVVVVAPANTNGVATRQHSFLDAV